LAKQHQIPGSNSLGKNALIERLRLLSALQKHSKQELQKSAEKLLEGGSGDLKKSDLILRLVTDDGARAKLLQKVSPVRTADAHVSLRPQGGRVRRIMAIALMATGSLGTLMGLLGALLMPLAGIRTYAWVKQNMTRAQSQAQSAGALLRTVTSSLESGIAALQDTKATLASLGDTLDATEPFLASVETLVSEQAPETFEASQDAIVSAAVAARSVDQFLRTLDSIRLITGVTYRPEVPLDESISAVADSLAPLAPGFKDVGDHLSEVRQELVLMGPELERVEHDLEDLSLQLTPVIEALEDQVKLLEGFSKLLDQGSSNISRVLSWVFGGLALGCLWLASSQWAVFVVGRELWQRGRVIDEPES
jgi:hypothetical protein